MIKMLSLFIALALAMLSFGGIAEADASEVPVLSDYFTDRDLSGSYDAAEAAVITLDGDRAVANSNAVSCEDGVVTISKKGTYILTGVLNDGTILVDVDDSDKVQLVLDGASISSATSAAILILSADKVFITLAEGTENALSNTGTYVENPLANIDGVIFSKSDLVINGAGSLTIDAATGHGIVAKDDFKVTGGSITIEAPEGHGIEAKDSIRVANGAITVSCGKDALHCENEDDAEKGYVVILGGAFDLTSGGDGISASNALTVMDGSFSILAGGGSANGNNHREAFDGGTRGNRGGMFERGNRGTSEGREEASDKSSEGTEASTNKPDDFQPGEVPEGMEPPSDLPDDLQPGKLPEGMEPPSDLPGDFQPGEMPDNFQPGEAPEGMEPPTGMPDDFQPGEAPEGMERPSDMPDDLQPGNASGNTASSERTESASMKGLKSGSGLVVYGGAFTLDTADDSLHTDGDCTINGGSFTLSSGDDGIHADGALTVNDGSIAIVKSYEGLEGASITINGGDIDVTASDDGLNASGGNDGSGRDGRDDMFATDATAWISIAGGHLTVDADGDGIDSNGNLVVTGGSTVVRGPVNSGNGALDFAGTGTITGGTVIALGASGMALNFGGDSTQASVLVTLSGTVSGAITLSDAEGNVLLAAENGKSYNSAVFSSPELAVGGTYTVTAGEISTDVTLDSLVSGGGSNRMGGGMRGMGGKKGGRGAGFSLESLGIDGLVLGDDGSVSLTEAAAEALLEQLRQFMPNTEVTVEQLRACATEQELMRLIGGANRGMGGGHSPTAAPEATPEAGE